MDVKGNGGEGVQDNEVSRLTMASDNTNGEREAIEQVRGRGK